LFNYWRLVYPYCIVQNIENLKLKVKNFENDQIKTEMVFLKTLTLLASFCLLLVAPKTICKSKERGGKKPKAKKIKIKTQLRN
jgi:hypothetical protein